MADNQIKSLQDLENEKLQLEIRELNKPWYKNPRWWTIIITGAAVAGTLFLSWATGLINVQQERLENEKNLLEIDIHEFTGQRDILLQEMSNLQDSLNLIRDSLQNKKIELIQSFEQNRQLRREMFIVEQDRKVMVDYYEEYIDSLVNVLSTPVAIGHLLTADIETVTVDQTEITADGRVLLNPKDGSILRNTDGTPIFFPGAGAIKLPDGPNK